MINPDNYRAIWNIDRTYSSLNHVNMILKHNTSYKGIIKGD